MDKMLPGFRPNPQKKELLKEIQQQQKDEMHAKAQAIVKAQPYVEGLRILDPDAEEILRCLLKCQRNEGNYVNYSFHIFPENLRQGIDLEMEKLNLYGMVENLMPWMAGGIVCLTPEAISYFVSKQEAMNRQKSQKAPNIPIRVEKLRELVREKGKNQTDVMLALVSETERLLWEMKETQKLPQSAGYYEELAKIAPDAPWFAMELSQLFGITILENMIR